LPFLGPTSTASEASRAQSAGGRRPPLIPELAEQMGRSPAMTLNTYAHVIRELKGEPVVSAEEQVERARRDRPGRFGDVGAAEAGGT
jgi:hypothetical protein